MTVRRQLGAEKRREGGVAPQTEKENEGLSMQRFLHEMAEIPASRWCRLKHIQTRPGFPAGACEQRAESD